MIATRFDSLHCLVGRTPLLAIHCRLHDRELTVHAKLETLNLTGSIKDRMALHVLEEALGSGELKPGDTIVEASSGNTGIAFAAVGRALGHPVRIYMPDWLSRERTQLIDSLGAEILPVSAEEGGFLGSIRRAEQDAERDEDVFLPRQFENEANLRAHEGGTGREIVDQLRAQGLTPTAFVAGVGTGGTVMGVGRALRAAFPGVTIHPLEPANSPTLRTGRRVGHHRIQGISDEFVPALVHLDELDEIVDVWDGDAILAAQQLAARLGLGVGISSGANLLGALKLAAASEDSATVVTVFPDSNKKYLSTDLAGEEALDERYLSGALELVGYSATPASR